MKSHHSLLDDPCFHLIVGGEYEVWTLPQVFAALASQAEVTSFEHLQFHQEQAWAAFLAQIAEMATRPHDHQLPQDAATWRRYLLDLSQGSEEAWCLVVEDLAKPAFMQPPVPESKLVKWKDFASPDQLDLLVTAKNFDIKQERVSRPELDHWIYPLINLQTHEGFGGKGNYGIARMNSGLGSRPRVTMQGAPGRLVRALLEGSWALVGSC